MVNPTYIDIKVYISENQRTKIKNAIDKGTGTTIQFMNDDLRGQAHEGYTLALTKTQIDKLAKAIKEGKGARLSFTKAQLDHNKTIEGGFIDSLVRYLQVQHQL